MLRPRVSRILFPSQLAGLPRRKPWESKPTLTEAIISLGRALPRVSSNLPADWPDTQTPAAPRAWGRFRLFGLAAGGVCRAGASHLGRDALLPHHFTLTQIAVASALGGIFLLHFPSAWANRPPKQPTCLFRLEVIQHQAPRHNRQIAPPPCRASSDFPHPPRRARSPLQPQQIHFSI